MPVLNVRDLVPHSQRDERIAIVAVLLSGLSPSHLIAGWAFSRGSAVCVLQMSSEEVATELPSEAAGFLPEKACMQLDAARKMVDRWEENKLDVRTINDANYPGNLLEMFNAPPLIFFRGSWNDIQASYSFAVVGTRNPSPAGEKHAADFTAAFVEAGFTIISGLATGIDTIAHQVALEEGGQTLAVMGTGIDTVFPVENRNLAEKICARGALCTQFFPSFRERPWSFPERRKTMSGLTLATVVIEAGERSGTRLQVDAALKQGRAVFLHEDLVGSQKWARSYVEKGKHGTHAISVSKPDDILNRFVGDLPRKLENTSPVQLKLA